MWKMFFSFLLVIRVRIFLFSLFFLNHNKSALPPLYFGVGNRWPDVAGVVLQTPSLLIHSVSSQWVSHPSWKYLQNSDEILRVCSPSTTYHMSCVTFHMFCVTCHISDVTYLVYIIFSFHIFFGHIFGARWWRVCYQRGLPRLVCLNLPSSYTEKYVG